MSLRQKLALIANYYRFEKMVLGKNADLLDIHEGNLLPYVEKELKLQISDRAFKYSCPRIPPINIERRVVDKLSQIYFKSPERKFDDKTTTDADKEMWSKFVDTMALDVSGQQLNEYFNLHRASAWEPYLDNRFVPRIREIPRDRFFVMGMDPTNKMRVTHFVKVMGSVAGVDDKGTACQHDVLYVYTDTEFLIMTEDGKVADELMSALPAGPAREGKNEFGVIPFIFANQSKQNINPSPDDDMYRMTTLIPMMFSDTNYAMMFQAFSMFWGVDVDLEKLPINPNAFINLKSDPNRPDVKPTINVIKADIDSEKAVKLIMDQLGLWLQSKGIRPGSVGTANADSFENGISKMIDEMDTTAARKKQIPVFKNAEEELFYLIAYRMHPIWSRNASYKEKRGFSQNLVYTVKFAEQISWQTRMETVAEAKVELDAGILSKESAMRRVNPEMTDEQIKAELAKIEAENKAAAPADPAGKSGGQPAPKKEGDEEEEEAEE